MCVILSEHLLESWQQLDINIPIIINIPLPEMMIGTVYTLYNKDTGSQPEQYQ